MNIIERVARVLAGQHYSRNAEGAAPEGVHVSSLVDIHWQDHVGEAAAVLRTLREPDPAMMDAAEPFAIRSDALALWKAMVRAAVGEEWDEDA
jgi:hypothetical protein